MTESKLTGVALGAALVVLAAWLILLLWLAFNTGLEEQQWARLGSVLGSLEAVAFAAAGALFGTTVQKQRVEEANLRAQKAEQTSKDNAQAAINGKALAKAVKARGMAMATAQGEGQIEEFVKSAGAEDVLVVLAKELFPD